MQERKKEVLNEAVAVGIEMLKIVEWMELWAAGSVGRRERGIKGDS